MNAAEEPSARLFRFAPSPNGFLHLGHAYSALMNQTLAAQADGTVLLRMEDIDSVRCSVAYEQAIQDDLVWLGFVWKGTPLRQSQRGPLYRAQLDALAARGLLYPCTCTRGEVARVVASRPGWPRDPDGAPLYPGTCRVRPASERACDVAAGHPVAMRLDITKALAVAPRDLGWTECREGDEAIAVAAKAESWGDIVLARKDIGTSYHLAVVTDDAAQGITDIVRGADLYPATGLHRLLQELLGFPAPTYRHHRLILDHCGQKLSKTHNAPALRTMREAGASPDDVRLRLGFAPR